MTLNRPERMNSMAFDVMVPLKKVLDELTYDNSVRAVVLTGAGRGFSSGADHKSAGSVPHVDGLTRPTFALRSMEVLDDVILSLRKMHQPVIAAVNGAAIGGGLCLALACDIRVAAAGAYFRAAGINNGLTASELGLSYLLPRAIGTSRAFELMLTGRDVDAEEAERIGLVSRTVPDDELLDVCYEMAERIAAFSRPGIELTKRTLWSGLDAASLEGHMQAEGLGQLYRAFAHRQLRRSGRSARREAGPRSSPTTSRHQGEASVITATDLEVRAGARTLLSADGPALRVQPGDRIGLVGRNGAGKTTTMRILAGEGEPYAGTIARTGEIGYLPQDPREGDLDMLARDRVLSARGLDTLLADLEKQQALMAEVADDAARDKAVRRYGQLEERFAALGGYAAESEAGRICASLGLPERVLTQPLRTLSGGQRRRVELARILFAASESGAAGVSSTTTLLLDEPTNHLDADSIGLAARRSCRTTPAGWW